MERENNETEKEIKKKLNCVCGSFGQFIIKIPALLVAVYNREYAEGEQVAELETRTSFAA